MLKLTKGWIELPLVDFIQFLPTGVSSYKGKKKYYSTGSIKNSEHVAEGEFSFNGKPSRANRISKAGDVFQARMKNTDKGILIDDKLNDELFSTGFIQLRPIPNTYNSKLLYYYVKSNYFLDQKDDLATGSTQEALTDSKAKEINLLVPPFNEQKRIVEKLDKLIAKVESANERLAKIPKILKKFRQSVLHAAVTGELTKDWRGNKDFSRDEVKLVEVAELRLGKMLDKSKNQGEFVKYLRNINVRWFTFDLTDLSELKITNEELKKLDIKNNDVLVCEGGEPGRCAVWNLGENELTFQKALHRVRVNKYLNPNWLAYNIKNDADSKDLERYFTGSTIKHFTGKSLKSYKFLLPPKDEQDEIVTRVEELFDKADQIENRYKKAKQFTDKLSQSILAKAFRGELVPQDPNDEPAEKLIERIKAEREKQKRKENERI